nr:hypothetical protein [Stratiformator vulcanicus]
MLRRATKSAEPGQGEEDSPFHVGTCSKHPVGFFTTHKVLPLSISTDRRRQIGEGVVRDEFPPNRRPEYLLCHSTATADCVACKLLIVQQIEPPFFRVTLRDVAEILSFAEVLNEVTPGVSPHRFGRLLYVLPRRVVVVDESFQSGLGALRNKAGGCQLFVERLFQTGYPSSRVIVGAVVHQQRRDETLNADLDRFGRSLVDLAETNAAPFPVTAAELNRSTAGFLVDRDACHNRLRLLEILKRLAALCGRSIPAGRRDHTARVAPL